VARLDHLAIPVRHCGVSRDRRILLWGYGAELRDPGGYLVFLWDETSMREKGGSGDAP
jgi:hypothetical protein